MRAKAWFTKSMVFCSLRLSIYGVKSGSKFRAVGDPQILLNTLLAKSAVRFQSMITYPPHGALATRSTDPASMRSSSKISHSVRYAVYLFIDFMKRRNKIMSGSARWGSPLLMNSSAWRCSQVPLLAATILSWSHLSLISCPVIIPPPSFLYLCMVEVTRPADQARQHPGGDSLQLCPSEAKMRDKENKADSLPRLVSELCYPRYGWYRFLFGRVPSMEQPELVMKFLTVLGIPLMSVFWVGGGGAKPIFSQVAWVA